MGAPARNILEGTAGRSEGYSHYNILSFGFEKCCTIFAGDPIGHPLFEAGLSSILHLSFHLFLHLFCTYSVIISVWEEKENYSRIRPSRNSSLTKR